MIRSIFNSNFAKKLGIGQLNLQFRRLNFAKLSDADKLKVDNKNMR